VRVHVRELSPTLLPVIDANTRIRIARPTSDIARAERFWTEGVGLAVLWRADDAAIGGHTLVVLGIPGAAWHLEIVDDQDSAATSLPSAEDILVIYLGEQPSQEILARVTAAGGRRTRAKNPYWDRCGVTFVDPDGYLLNLCERNWTA
jgi:catechol 2,3-dioxygenase-like lactoylglutathione lyase family enzyme